MDDRIRPAAPEDAEIISRIHAESWKVGYVGLIPQQYLDELPEDRWVPGARKWLKTGTLRTNLLFDGVNPVGSVTYGPSRDSSKADWGEIVAFYVRPEYWRQGCGRRLMDSALQSLREQSFQHCFLWVLDGNRRAMRFYEAMGFEASEDTTLSEIAGKTLTECRYSRRI